MDESQLKNSGFIIFRSIQEHINLNNFDGQALFFFSSLGLVRASRALSGAVEINGTALDPSQMAPVWAQFVSGTAEVSNCT